MHRSRSVFTEVKIDRLQWKTLDVVRGLTYFLNILSNVLNLDESSGIFSTGTELVGVEIEPADRVELTDGAGDAVAVRGGAGEPEEAEDIVVGSDG